MKKRFSTQNLVNVFEKRDYDEFRSLCSEYIRGNELFEYDEEGNKVVLTKKQASDAIRKVFMEICNLTEEDLKSKKKRLRAEKAHALEIFEVIEEDIEFKVQTGFMENEWFEQFVEHKNLALGDENEFWTQQEIILEVAEVSGNHHDLTIQSLNEGEKFSVKTSAYAVKIGRDIDLIILGRIDYAKLVNKVAEAYQYKIQNMCFGAVYDARTKLPTNSQFNKTGALDKTKLDTLIEDVETANTSNVVIMGTKTALKNLNGLTDVDWRAESQKEAVANTGRIGNYEGTTLVEIPQRFALNDVTTKLIPNDILLIFPLVEEKFVKLVDVGETEIVEVTEKAAYMDDFQTYEVQREFGVGIQITQYFGAYKIEP